MVLKEITRDNLDEASRIQLEIFGPKNGCAYLQYLLSFTTPTRTYYLVYHKNEVVGITGLYEDEFSAEEGVVWLGWFGVLPKFRHLGYGSHILMMTIDLARSKGYKMLRCYVHVKENKLGINLLERLMTFSEHYTAERKVKSVDVYTKILDKSDGKKLNNRYLNLEWHVKTQKEGYKLYTRKNDKKELFRY